MDIVNHEFEAAVRSMTSSVAHRAVEGHQRDSLGRKIWGFEPGDVCIFDSHGADSQMNNLTGQAVTVIRKLTEDEVDVAEVGPMYLVQLESGKTADVFEGEITEALPFEVPGTQAANTEPTEADGYKYKLGSQVEFRPSSAGREAYSGMRAVVCKVMGKDPYGTPRYGVQFSDGMSLMASETELVPVTGFNN